jgi:integrase
MAVTKQKNGTWWVDVSNGFSPLGGEQNRHRKKGFKTKKEAEEYEANYRLNVLQQIKVRDKISIELLYSLLKKEDELRGNSQSTKDTQQSYYKQYVSHFFKNADMKRITTDEVKQFRDWLSIQPSVKGGTLSTISVNQQMIFIHKLFEIAILKGFVTTNPASALRKLPNKHKEMNFYTPEQFKQFLSLIEQDEYQYKLLYEILMFTGARMGEALALTWSVVNLDEGYIDIKNSAHYRKKKVTIGATKTAQSVRRIYIHKAFIEELKHWKKKQFKLLEEFLDSSDDLQIYQTSPEILTHPQVSGFRHDKLKKRMPTNLKLIRNHDFRHSHAAFLISQGLRQGEGKDYLFFTLMKRLGHTSITTTINTYSHLFPTQQKEIASAFDDF